MYSHECVCVYVVKHKQKDKPNKYILEDKITIKKEPSSSSSKKYPCVYSKRNEKITIIIVNLNK